MTSRYSAALASESETDSSKATDSASSPTISERSSTAWKVKPPLNQIAPAISTPANTTAAALMESKIVSRGVFLVPGLRLGLGLKLGPRESFIY